MMFFKLCKHELKCSYRSFSFLYAVLLAVALLFSPNWNMTLSTITMIVYFVVLVVLFVMCLLVILRNYSNSMFSRNSYLTHTLPVSTTTLLLTKTLSAVFWSVVSLIVVFISILLMVFRLSGVELNVIMDGISTFFSSTLSFEFVGYLLYLLCSIIQTISLIYLVMNMTHTTYIKRFRPAIAFVLYLIIDFVVLFLITKVFEAFHVTGYGLFSFNTNMYALNENMYTANSLINVSSIYILLGTSIFMIVVYFFASKYIIEHKLEIE